MMKHLSLLIKPASSLCNMRCKYCFYANVSDCRDVRDYGIMQEKTTNKVLDAVFTDLKENDFVTFAFQGGEPTMAGLNYFRHFVFYADECKKKKKVTVDYSIQTNGLFIDDEWCEFLKKNNFLVGLSLDGTPEYHDQNRLDQFGVGTYIRVSNTVKLFKKYKIDFNVLCVLTKENAKEPQKLWEYFMETNIRFLQFIPCIPELDEVDNEYSLTPELFHDFYVAIFKLWIDQIKKHNYISVKLFDDMANMLVYRRITGCGLIGNCSLQYIIEADGSVYPCDFYVLDEYCLGNLKKNSLSQIREAYEKSAFHRLRGKLSTKCENCKVLNLCHGGCIRLRQSMYIRDGYCGYGELLSEIGDSLIQAAYIITTI